MRPTGLIKSRRWIWFGIPFLCLSYVMYVQTFRLMYWTQRRDRHAEALEFSGAEIDAKLVERLTPTVARLMLFVPPGQKLAALPVIHTETGRGLKRTHPTRLETADEPGRVQLTCSLYSGEETTSDYLHYHYLAHSGVTITPDFLAREFRLPAKERGWKIDPRLEEGLISDGEDTYFLPLFINDRGQSVGLEITDTSDSP